MLVWRHAERTKSLLKRVKETYARMIVMLRLLQKTDLIIYFCNKNLRLIFVQNLRTKPASL